MKTVFFVILMIFFTSVMFAQGYSSGRHDSALNKAESMLGARYHYSGYSLDLSNRTNNNLEKPHKFGAPRALYYNKLYLLGELSDTTAIFSHSRGIYMGQYIQEKNKPTFLRSGFGIDKIMDDSSIDDIVKYEYYIGFYKKNRRHGEGYLMKTNGKMVTGIWKRGRLKPFARRELTAEEQEKVQDYIRQLNNLM